MARRKLPPAFRDAVRGDAVDTIVLRVLKRDSKNATPEDPYNCAVARCCRRNGYQALIMVTTSWVLRPATKEWIQYNRRHDRKIADLVKSGQLRVGTDVVMRYMNSQQVTREVDRFDDSGPPTLDDPSWSPHFPNGFFVLRAPTTGDSRYRATRHNDTRYLRANSKRDGTPPGPSPQWRRLDRVARVQALLRGEAA